MIETYHHVGLTDFLVASGTWQAVFSKTDLAIVFAAVIGALCVALYQAWIEPIQAIVALVILIVAAVALTVFTT
jgi:hypothetical protein